MDNIDNQELSDDQHVVEPTFNKNKDDPATIIETNDETEEELLISQEYSHLEQNEQSDKECTEKESGIVESISNNDILQHINVLSTKIDSLNLLFSEKIRYSEYEGKIIDKMQEELKKYKEDMYAQLIKLVLLDIIEVRDSILRVTDFYLKKPEGERDIPNEMFAGYALEIQDILEKNGVEIYKSNLGDNFVPIKQRAIKKVDTEDNKLQGKVAESFSCGYNFNEKTISAEKVSVYYYKEPEIIS